MKYHLLPSFLLAGYQAQQKTIAAQANQIAKLKQRLAAIEAMLQKDDQGRGTLGKWPCGGASATQPFPLGSPPGGMKRGPMLRRLSVALVLLALALMSLKPRHAPPNRSTCCWCWPPTSRAASTIQKFMLQREGYAAAISDPRC